MMTELKPLGTVTSAWNTRAANHTTPKFRAGGRKQFIASVAKVLEEYEQGRGATACMDDIKKAMGKLKGSLK